MEQMKHSFRDSCAGVRFQWIWGDLSYGARCLRRSPGFSIAAIFVLSLAIGANSAIFSVIEGVLLGLCRTAIQNVYASCGSLFRKRTSNGIGPRLSRFVTGASKAEVFEDVATVLRPEASKVTMRSDSGSEEIQASIVSGNFFDLLRVRPLLGHTFSSSEAHRGENVAVISYGMWKRRFGGTNAILGKSIQLNNQIASIIGVMPPDFNIQTSKRSCGYC